MTHPLGASGASPRGGDAAGRARPVRGLGSSRPARGARGQRGAVLLIAAVVLALMALASLGVLRAADTGNLISGNYSFQQAATQASDRTVSDGLAKLQTVVPSGGGNNNIANVYFSTKQTPVDARGVPTAIDWANVPCVDPDGVGVATCGVDNGGYRIQYVIERQCASNPDMANINDIRARCEYEPSTGALSATSIGIRYRIIARVRGPRGTLSWYESVVSGPAST